MKQKYLSRGDDNRRLVLIFSGWAHDDAFFSELSCAGCDIMVVWDYRDFDFDTKPLGAYDEVYLFAWSFGVYAAGVVLPRMDRRNLTFTVAINGSLCPVDNEKGIPVPIFAGTRDSLNQANLNRFYRRIVGDRKRSLELSEKYGKKDIDQLREELTAIDSCAQRDVPLYMDWDRVIIAENDKIFPVDNLRKAWEGNLRVRTVKCEHLPDWKALIDSEIIDSEHVGRNFAKNASSYEKNATVQHTMAQHLWDMWQEAAGDEVPESICEIGYGTGLLTRLYTEKFSAALLTLIDAVPFQPQVAQACNILTGDAEQYMRLFPASSFDVIVSGATVQWFNSLRRFIHNALQALRPGGMLIFSTFGPDNLKELSAVTGLSLRYYSTEEISCMVDPDDGVVVALEESREVLEFPSAKEVVEHLHLTGVNGMRGNKTSLSEIYERYPHNEDGGVQLTYHPIYILIQKRS